MKNSRPKIAKPLYDFISNIGNGSFQQGLIHLVKESRFIKENNEVPKTLISFTGNNTDNIGKYKKLI